jgi:NAD(P)-dependent dehydrogenase (short-subunit alcohol dehydrogenase family)
MLISDTGAFEFGHAIDIPMRALAGKRVLITGVSAAGGIDIARSFAEAGARLILQCNDASPAVEALATMLAPVAAELSVHTVPLATSDEIVGFARDAAAEFGGLDMVINVVSLDAHAPTASATLADVEARVSDVLLKACLVSRVAANRMRLMLKDGVILTVATLNADATAAERGFAQVVRTTLAAMTRSEAQTWADKGIRFNAVAPDVLSVVAKSASGREADVAQLALYLAAGNGEALSGLTFELGLLEHA